jgi:hypothetical protein
MAHISLSQLKRATRDRSLRREGERGPEWPTPIPTATSAVKRFHQDGAAAAIRQLDQAFDRSDYWGPAGRPQARGWANSIRRCFQGYVDLASGDRRAVVQSPMTTTVQVGGDTVGVSVDVVLSDAAGHVGRVLLWDTPPLTRGDAEILAAVVVQAVNHEFGRGRSAGAEIWHLRSGVQVFVDATTATRRLREVRTIVRTYVS